MKSTCLLEYKNASKDTGHIEGVLPSWAAETACFRAISVSVVGFWENACAALFALAALVATPPTMPGKAELCTAFKLAINELGVTELGILRVEESTQMKMPRTMSLLVNPQLTRAQKM